LGGSRHWQRPTAPKSKVALTPPAVVVVDERPDRIIALNPASGAELVNVRSEADVLAVGPAGMIIVKGRDMAYLRFHGSGGVPTQPPASGNPGNPGAPEDDCDGPKQEICPAG
jgi:ABC-type Fe3+-hydroxamate transport system substrate-binding protein